MSGCGHTMQHWVHGGKNENLICYSYTWATKNDHQSIEGKGPEM